MKKPPTIRDLYPHFTEEQLAEAEEAIDRYLEIVLCVFERRFPDNEVDSGSKKFESPQGSTCFCGKCDF